ncbi:DUF2282 domain-containing protein [Burkholderia vietnamiensis]|uniref:BufA1 family periplasmic bufferin-type metallophore n=1 Tax=Burkholderia vietnamiensis TaxID=60552 RepID=UPI000B0FBD06
MMNSALSRQPLLAIELAGIAASAAPAAQIDDTVRCFGIAKAGQNDCASKIGVHDYAGEAKVDSDKDEFKNVPKGTCKQMGGNVGT